MDAIRSNRDGCRRNHGHSKRGNDGAHSSQPVVWHHGRVDPHNCCAERGDLVPDGLVVARRGTHVSDVVGSEADQHDGWLEIRKPVATLPACARVRRPLLWGCADMSFGLESYAVHCSERLELRSEPDREAVTDERYPRGRESRAALRHEQEVAEVGNDAAGCT